MDQTLQDENREYMRDHYKTRVWSLRTHRINDVMYLDTFFASVKSIREYKCFQMFALKSSKFNRLALIRKKASAPEAYEDCIRAVGAPNKTVTDNSQVLTGTKWTNIVDSTLLGLTIPKHQHHNYYEQGVGTSNLLFSDSSLR